MAEHEIHHRGQLYLELSMLELPTPPIYGLTSEQVKERSLPLPEKTRWLSPLPTEVDEG